MQGTAAGLKSDPLTILVAQRHNAVMPLMLEPVALGIDGGTIFPILTISRTIIEFILI